MCGRAAVENQVHGVYHSNQRSIAGQEPSVAAHSRSFFILKRMDMSAVIGQVFYIPMSGVYDCDDEL